MYKNSITIMIISTIPDMIAEHYYFIKYVFPQLKDICSRYGIALEYVEMVFSMSENEFNQGRSIRKYFQSMDLDRTFFICFRGQKLGRSPTHETIDKATLDEYPELVDYIGDTSFTELMIMHALKPFEKRKNGGHEFLPPVKHALFYFRDEKYLDDLNTSQKELYTSSGSNEDAFVRDLKLAMSKDLVVSNKMELDNKKEICTHINIRKYEGVWDDDLVLMDLLVDYTKEYARINNMSYDYLTKVFDRLDIGDFKGAFSDFKCGDIDLKDAMAEDFFNEIQLEFPDLF